MKLIRMLALFAILAVLEMIVLDQLLSGRFGFADRPVYSALPELLKPVTPLSRMCFWLAFGLLPILYVVTNLAIWRRRPRAFRVRTAEGDTILIHPGAIINFVRQSIESHPAVVSQRVRVRQLGSRGVAVRATVNVQPTESLPRIHRQLEQSIREGFSEVLGIEKIDEITIIMGLDEKNMNRRPGATRTPKAKPEPPTRGALDPEPTITAQIPPPSDAVESSETDGSRTFGDSFEKPSSK